MLCIRFLFPPLVVYLCRLETSIATKTELCLGLSLFFFSIELMKSVVSFTILLTKAGETFR